MLWPQEKALCGRNLSHLTSCNWIVVSMHRRCAFTLATRLAFCRSGRNARDLLWLLHVHSSPVYAENSMHVEPVQQRFLLHSIKWYCILLLCIMWFLLYGWTTKPFLLREPRNLLQLFGASFLSMCHPYWQLLYKIRNYNRPSLLCRAGQPGMWCANSCLEV